MAQRRMFNKTITNNDNFLEMPQTSQNLYFHLSMNADDDGFVDNWKSIMRMTGCKEDDLKVLIAKQYIIPFESGVIVIRHWRLNNYLQKDRITTTNYKDELSQLSIDDNNAYTLEKSNVKDITFTGKVEKTDDARQKRIDAKKESDLPYSFEYKIRNAFIGKLCPICNREMNATSDKNKPTIQHNKPISLGGKHEIDNISVICSNCNCSIQNRVETPPYNTEEVKQIWECIGNVYTDKNSIDKNSINNNKEDKLIKRFIKPTIEEIQEYCTERNNGINANAFYDFYESKNWYVGKNKMKDWKACVRTWEQRTNTKTTKVVPNWFDKEITSNEGEEDIEFKTFVEELEKCTIG